MNLPVEFTSDQLTGMIMGVVQGLILIGISSHIKAKRDLNRAFRKIRTMEHNIKKMAAHLNRAEPTMFLELDFPGKERDIRRP